MGLVQCTHHDLQMRSFYFHVVSLVLNSCISISSVDLRQVLIFTFAYFSRWARTNHLFLNFCPTLLQQLLILSHIRFIRFTNQYVEHEREKIGPIKYSIINYFLKTFSVLTVQVGHMIQAESDNTKRDEYLKRLMSLPNQVSCLVF